MLLTNSIFSRRPHRLNLDLWSCLGREEFVVCFRPSPRCDFEIVEMLDGADAVLLVGWICYPVFIIGAEIRIRYCEVLIR